MKRVINNYDVITMYKQEVNSALGEQMSVNWTDTIFSFILLYKSMLTMLGMHTMLANCTFQTRKLSLRLNRTFPIKMVYKTFPPLSGSIWPNNKSFETSAICTLTPASQQRQQYRLLVQRMCSITDTQPSSMTMTMNSQPCMCFSERSWSKLLVFDGYWM